MGELKEIIAIAVETGVQDTGMAIFVLWFKMDHPAGDLAAVVNAAVATLTPVHLLAALGYYSLRTKLCTGQIKQKKEENIFKDKDAEVNFISKDESQDGSNGDSGLPGIQGMVGPQGVVDSDQAVLVEQKTNSYWTIWRERPPW